MKTLHMIGNAHLDPVWLWTKSDGTDSALATARSACDRLDEYDDFVFTCSGLWFHETIERLDPSLFERVKAFVAAGRWQLVGGMVVQPDCNLPSATGLRRQLELGQRYFRQRFGRTTSVGYNVDSFGHSAYLPERLREAGIDAYCFMRPEPDKRPLPAELFRWRSPNGHEVTTFRIAKSYTTSVVEISNHVQAAIAAMPREVNHTMCFFGVGDHGGGPTRAQIEWIRANAEAFPGVRLVFSHPRAFFDAVAADVARLPVVEGELHYFAIGCYSVERRIKVAMRRAESRLVQAERAVESLSASAPPDAATTLDQGWRAVCFNQFHDILCGTSLFESSRIAAAEMAAAESSAMDLLTLTTRPAVRADAVPGQHRIALYNPGPLDFDGWLSHEPWLQWRHTSLLSLTDETGQAVPHQVIEPRSLTHRVRALLFRLQLPAGAKRLLQLHETPLLPPPTPIDPGTRPADQGPFVTTLNSLHHDSQRVTINGPQLSVGDWGARLEIIDEPTDTWGNNAGPRFDGRVISTFSWPTEAQVREAGPLRGALLTSAAAESSQAWLRVMLTAGEAAVRLRLRVTWAERHRLLRLRIVSPARVTGRTDLVSGGELRRPIDGREYPLNGGLLIETPAARLGLAAPDVFSVSVDDQGISLTLLRSPMANHHHPRTPQSYPDHWVTDQGSHEFDLLLWPGAADLESLRRQSEAMLMPPLVWELTG